MRMSKSFVPTLKEVPADATVASHQLLVRAGYIRQLAAGIYSILPLCQRSILKITAIVREEMNAIGAQEFYLPALNPREVWEESGRWTVMGENMFRLKDRKGADLCLAMTHEEVFTVLARAELRSYRQLPQSWYQIQTKFRDEPRPKSGLLRVRQFTMKDSYSFDLDRAGLDKSFEAHRQAYVRIFGRCGLKTVQVDAHSGAMGGSGSTEFMVPTDAGEDLIASCESCGYAANTEKAESRVETPDKYKAAGESPQLQDFATPGVVTIEALSNPPYAVAADQQLKTLVYVGDDKPIVAIVRGDDQLNEAKLQTASGASVLRPAHPEEIQKWMGAKPGSLGGVGLAEKKNIQVFLDTRLVALSGLVTGAN
jgi:prolyl-tRNA synthetase